MFGAENAVTLCANCRLNFDSTNDPGFTFFPSNLSWLSISKMRGESRLRQTGWWPLAYFLLRWNTNPTFYIDVGEEDSGGLYERILFSDFLGPLCARPTNLRPWHGTPIAAIRRAIHATGTLRVEFFPSELLMHLRTLQDLYSRTGPEVHNRSSVTTRQAKISSARRYSAFPSQYPKLLLRKIRR